LDIADFDFDLPDELIAQDPPGERGQSRLLVVHRDTGHLDHASFVELPDFLRAGDLLVVNNTRVFPARLIGRREPSGGVVECLLLRQLPALQRTVPDPGTGDFAAGRERDLTVAGSRGGEAWEALVHPGQKLKPGARVRFDGAEMRLNGEILDRHFHGRRTVRLWRDDGRDVIEAIESIGHIPLPPYIRRADRPDDRERYQTVYARASGSVAAPTAGLHFTSEILDELAARGVERTVVTLHVGYGTFKPIRTSRVEDHTVDPEPFRIGAETAAAVNRARREGRRIIAVGTTTVRVLESLALDAAGEIRASSGEASLFIRPGHRFRLVDGLITNFHLPRSSLFVLVSAFAGRERALDAYHEAIRRRYRFYSYGDAMFIV
jgi:S-adenosylmethionine:tRNA ribosyltransferase-isomerase